jgi:hypothetical protein
VGVHQAVNVGLLQHANTGIIGPDVDLDARQCHASLQHPLGHAKAGGGFIERFVLPYGITRHGIPTRKTARQRGNGRLAPRYR